MIACNVVGKQGCMLSKLELAAMQTDAYHAYIHTANLESGKAE